MKNEKQIQKRYSVSGVTKTAAIVVGAAAVGATLAYFLDSESGKKRRERVLDMTSQRFNGLSGLVTGAVASGLAFIKENLGIDLGEQKSSESDIDESMASDGQQRLSSSTLNRRDSSKTAYREMGAAPYSEQ